MVSAWAPRTAVSNDREASIHRLTPLTCVVCVVEEMFKASYVSVNREAIFNMERRVSLILEKQGRIHGTRCA